MTDYTAKARELLEPHRIYCDHCILVGNCGRGGPFCAQCDELVRMPAIATSIAAAIREAVEAEREACAKICAIRARSGNRPTRAEASALLNLIRARGEVAK